jgi:hypothetical protein
MINRFFLGALCTVALVFAGFVAGVLIPSESVLARTLLFLSYLFVLPSYALQFPVPDPSTELVLIVSYVAWFGLFESGRHLYERHQARRLTSA